MSSEAADIRIEVVLQTGGGEEEMEILVLALRGELADLPGSRVERGTTALGPEGTRSAVPIDPGTLIVLVEHGGPALVAVVQAIRSWLDRRRASSPQPAPTIKVRLGRDSVVLTPGELSPDQRRVLDAFLAVHPDQ